MRHVQIASIVYIDSMKTNVIFKRSESSCSTELTFHGWFQLRKLRWDTLHILTRITD